MGQPECWVQLHVNSHTVGERLLTRRPFALKLRAATSGYMGGALARLQQGKQARWGYLRAEGVNRVHCAGVQIDHVEWLDHTEGFTPGSTAVGGLACTAHTWEQECRSTALHAA